MAKGSQIDYINEKWYSWEPLHYAAKAADPDKLALIVEKLGPSKINSLTTLSENALHVLLNHGQSDAFNISYQNGSSFRLSKILASEKNNLIKCTQILIDGGIDINHPNFWNETPIVIALKRKYYGVIKLLLQKPEIDLDGSQEGVSRKTPRDLFKGKEDQFGVLPKHTTHHTPGKILFQLLKSGDEDGFLKYRGGKLGEDLVNSFDGVDSSNSSCTLIQYCFRRGLITWLQEKKLCQDELMYSLDITCHHLVQVFSDNGMAKCIQHLVENSVDICCTLRKFPRPLLEVAVQKGYYPFIALILGQPKLVFHPSDICHLLIRLLEADLDDSDFDNTLSMLLNKLLLMEEPLQNKEIRILGEVLQRKARMINKDNLLLLLKFPGALCTRRTNSTKSILEEIDPEVIQTHLNDCVEEKNDEVRINYESLINKQSNSTDLALKTFLKTPMLNIFLNHLVLKLLIKRKWDNLKYYDVKYFIVNLWFYIFFYCILHIYILYKFQRMSDNFEAPLYYLNLLCMVVFVVKESGQVWANRQTYVKELSNYAEITFVTVTLMVYFMDMNSSWIDIPMVLSVLSSNLVLLLLLEQVPKFARYIIILHTVVFYLRYIIFYFLQFVAFATCFYILFTQREAIIWVELPNKIYQTVLAFTGNFEAVQNNNFSNKELFSKMVFILFVLFMAIILNNLLLGLLVTDMGDLNQNVKVIEQMKRASFVVRLENFLPFISRFGHSVTALFTDDQKYLVVREHDREMLEDNEKQHLDFILVKTVKKQNALLKLYSYIKSRINAISTNQEIHDLNKEMYQKLVYIEERLRILQEMTEFAKK